MTASRAGDATSASASAPARAVRPVGRATTSRRAARLAHRGDWRHAPENSIAALAAALAVPGCDGLEFDIRASRDGVPVLAHDETLLRVHGDPRRVDEVTADELAVLGVATLAAALAAIPRRAILDVELKDDSGRGAFDALVAARGPALARAVVSSFAPAALERIAGLAPAWPRWLNAHDLEPATLRLARELGCRVVSVQWRAIDAGSMRGARAAGLEVAAWTVRRRPTAARLDRLGVVAICVEAAALDG